jgi:hypothetical protein
MPTQNEINEYIVQLIDKRYQEGVLRSQFDVVAGALAVMRLFSLLDEKDEGEEEVWEDNEDGSGSATIRFKVEKKWIFDQIIYSSSNYSSYSDFGGILSEIDLKADDTPLEMLPQEVEKEIESLKNDPGHAGERAEVTDRFSQLVRNILNFNNEGATGISSDEIKNIGEKFKDMSQRYKELRRHYKYGIEKSQELKPEYDDLLHRCEEVLRVLNKTEEPEIFYELDKFLRIIKREEKNRRQ